MSVPMFREKLKVKPLLSAKKYIDYLRKKGVELPQLPSLAVLSMSEGITKSWAEDKKFKQVSALGFKFRIFETFCIVTNIDIGGPAMSILIEELEALGVTEFYLAGIAGGLSNKLEPGDVVIATKALRDEGASYNYLSDKYPYVESSLECIESLSKTFQKNDTTFTSGATWTTDCPYRETGEEVIKYRSEGILTVEMEAATLFAVAKFKGLKALAMFVVSDVLQENNWEPHFYHKEVGRGYRQLLNMLSENLAKR